MENCWQEDPEERPSFSDIYNSLENMLTQNEVKITLYFFRHFKLQSAVDHMSARVIQTGELKPRGQWGQLPPLPFTDGGSGCSFAQGS